MPQLSPAEQGRLARLTMERMRRRALARMLGSPLMRWRYGAPVADELLIIPQELRTADPSFAAEIRLGHFGLGGRVAYLETGSPFDLTPPSVEWAEQLHGFGWLRHLKAAGDDVARRTALTLVKSWITTPRYRRASPPNTAVIGRRLISWLSNAGWLLDGADQKSYDIVADAMADQLVRLSAVWRDAREGYPRMLVVTALVYGDLCVSGRDRRLKDAVECFGDEIDRQVMPDGGHVSRNPGVLVEMLLDFLPLRQIFAAREKPVPEALEKAIARMIPMLRYMRLGDGTLGRFNGMGAPSVDALATVLAYDPDPSFELTSAPHSRYARLQRGPAVLVADCGSPPPLEFAGQSHAGCLAFELSIGTSPVFVNGGAPGPADQDWRAASRATASHNVLCIGTKSSSKLVRHPLLESLIGSAPIRFPNDVTDRLLPSPTHVTLEASHDGYIRAFGLAYRRILTLAGDGRALDGVERITGPKGAIALGTPLPFAVHFHLHPTVTCDGVDDASADLILRDGRRWRLAVVGAALSREESIHFADLAGPRQSQQLVARGMTAGDTTVTWRLEPVDGA